MAEIITLTLQHAELELTAARCSCAAKRNERASKLYIYICVDMSVPLEVASGAASSVGRCYQTPFGRQTFLSFLSSIAFNSFYFCSTSVCPAFFMLKLPSVTLQRWLCLTPGFVASSAFTFRFKSAPVILMIFFLCFCCDVFFGFYFFQQSVCNIFMLSWRYTLFRERASGLWPFCLITNTHMYLQSIYINIYTYIQYIKIYAYIQIFNYVRHLCWLQILIGNFLISVYVPTQIFLWQPSDWLNVKINIRWRLFCVVETGVK